jgi:hypothetical protein
MRRTDPVHQRLPLRNGRDCKAKLSVASIFKNALLKTKTLIKWKDCASQLCKGRSHCSV